MKKSTKSKGKAPAGPQVDPYLEGLMAKLLERLTGLERKVDTVIAQTAAKSAPGGESSPRPFQPGNHAQANEPRRKDRVLYEAICADCRKVCEVPFKPSEGRAVYCKECFAVRKSGGPNHAHNAPRPSAVPPVSRPAAAEYRPGASSPAALAPARESSGKSHKAGAHAKKAKKKK